MSGQQHHEGNQPCTGPITQDRGGGCPYCGQNEGYMNIGRSHWYSCSKHKTKWLIGENLFSSWRDENPSIWKQNAQKLEGYKEVCPIYAAPDEWLGKPLRDKGITEANLQREIIAGMIDRLNERQRRLCGGNNVDGEFPNVFHVDVRGQLQPRDWADELHPTDEGFAKVGALFEAVIATALERFPGV